VIKKLDSSTTGTYRVDTSHGTHYILDMDKKIGTRVRAEGRGELWADGDPWVFDAVFCKPVIEGVVTDSLSRYKPFGWAGGMGHHYFFPDWIDQATGLVGWHCSECETKSKEKNDLSM